MLWNVFSAMLGSEGLLSQERLKTFLLSDFGRLESPALLLPMLDALTLENSGSITLYVSNFQQLRAPMGVRESSAEDVNWILKGLSSSMSTHKCG